MIKVKSIVSTNATLIDWLVKNIKNRILIDALYFSNTAFSRNEATPGTKLLIQDHQNGLLEEYGNQL
tara:strand:- start:46 stop:246 length:201 start_codon:yes stop_codon:yes gene_type:complete